MQVTATSYCATVSAHCYADSVAVATLSNRCSYPGLAVFATAAGRSTAEPTASSATAALRCQDLPW